MFSPRYNHLGKLAFMIFSVIIAIGVLALSMAKAGWEMANQKGLSDSLREIEIQTEIKHEGQIMKSCYRLPETRVLPGYWNYQIKILRDNLWWYYADKPIVKIKTALLIADKRLMEAVRLAQEDPGDRLVWDTSLKAVEWLNKATLNLNNMGNQEPEKEFLRSKLTEAKFTYTNVFNTLAKKCLNGVQYQELSQKLIDIDEKEVSDQTI